jgi:hypothetical protein
MHNDAAIEGSIFVNEAHGICDQPISWRNPERDAAIGEAHGVCEQPISWRNPDPDAAIGAGRVVVLMTASTPRAAAIIAAVTRAKRGNAFPAN